MLGILSNAFVLDKNNLVIANPARQLDHIVISLDDKYFKKIDDLLARFSSGVPDLLECQKLTIVGDVKFGANIKIIGDVTINNDSDGQLLIESDSILRG